MALATHSHSLQLVKNRKAQVEISGIKDLNLLQKMFQDATDMRERSKLRAAIQTLREQELMNESPHQPDFPRRSLRQSRRIKRDGEAQNMMTANQSYSASNMNVPSYKKTTNVLSSLESTNKAPHVAKTSCEADSVFETNVEMEKPRVFVRNSSTRRNRRSRKSTTSRSSDLDQGSHNESRSALFSNSESRSEWSSTGGVITKEIVSSAPPVVPRRNISHNLKEHVTCDVIKDKEGHDFGPLTPETKHLSPKHQESPDISPYRSPSIYQGQVTSSEKPKRTSVALVQGATCQYKTITTSFRGPSWKPVSTSQNASSHSGEHRSVNNNNNRGYSHTEWQRPPNGAVTTKEHLSPTETTFPGGNNHHQKNSARVVLKALGKKLFSTKPKTSTGSGQQITSPASPADSGRFSNAAQAKSPVPEQFETPKSRKTLQPSPFQQRKNIFEQGAAASAPPKVSYAWNQPRTPKNRMADVASLSRSAGTFAPGSSTHRPEVRSDGKSDSDDTTVEELEGLLKQYTDPEKRVKIRDTIRLLKQSLQEGDSSFSGSHNLQAPHKAVFSTRTGSSPQQDEEPGAVEFTVSLQQKSPASSISRFAGRSTSLRNPRPSYQPSAQAVNRANSFKLSRPKDFILQKVGSSPQLTKVPETPPDDFKEYADSLNNNLPQYKVPDSTSFTHNKTASPFSTTPQTSFKKQLWTPPNSTSNAQQKTAFSSSPLARTSVASSLRRSESTKENRSSDFKPISVVHGNVRRSKSILGRILGQKLDAEKSPFKASSPVLSQEQTTPKTESPSPILTKKPPIHSPPKSESPTTPKTESPSPVLTKKPPIHSPPKSESPTPAPRAAPRSKTLLNTPSPTAEKSASKKTPIPLLRTVQSSSSGEEKPADKASKSPASFRSISSSTSSSSSSSSGDHIYEVAGSESDISSSESSKPRDSPTLSEIIQETREHHDNETVSVTQTSSVALSVDRDQNEELEVDQVFVEKVKERTTEDDSVQLEEKLSQKTSKYKVLQPLKSHEVTVCGHETAQYFNVQIVRPITPRKNNSTQNSPLPKTTDVTEKSLPKENKETRKSSSSVSSISSASDSEEVLSDDEESSGDDIDIDMDRYSTRALQTRVSVKKQIMAKEGGETVETKTTTTTNTTSSRRLRDRHNKPLNTGEDVKTRMQKFRGQLNGVAEKAPAPKRNVAVKIPGTAGKKLDVSKFEKGADENAKISSSAGKTMVTLKTTAPKSSYRTTPREEKMKNGVHKEEKVEKLNGSTSPDVESEQKTSNLSSGSSADDGIRTRRARRGRGNAEAENGADKLEKAASIATSELKDLGKAKESTEIVITTKKSRERVSQSPKEDVNNNTKPTSDDIAAPPSENTAQDSLDDWSARRRKRREKRLQESSPATTSGTENEKSSEEMKEEEKVIIKQTRAKLHHTHSLPAMSEIGSLGEYKFKVEMNGGKDIPTHAEEDEEAEIEFKRNEEEEQNEVDPEVSEVKGQSSRSSDARSSTSSANEDVEKSASPEDDGPSEVVMEIGEEERNVGADGIAENQSESSDRDVTQNEREWEETREVEEQKENVDDDEHQKENTEDEESVDVDADDAKEDEIDASVPADVLEAVADKETTENNRDSDESPTQTQTHADDAQSESIYNDETVEIETHTETQREEETPVEPTPIDEEVEESTPEETEKVVDSGPECVEEPKERPRRRHKEEQKETSAVEIESEKPRRRARRKDAEKTEEPAEEKPKRRHHRHKHHREEVEEETPQKEEKVVESTEKVEEIKGKKSRRHKEKEQTPEAETPSETKEETPAKIESEPQEKPKAEAEEAPKAMHISIDNVEEITDLKVLEKMLEVAAEYEDRRRIRSVIRAVKRGEKPRVIKDSKYESKSNGGINALNLQGSRKHEPKAGGLPQEGARESRFATSRTTVTKIEKTDSGSRFSSRTVEKTTRMTSGPKKIGSIFDRGDDDDDVKPKSRGSGSSRFADLERRQAERKREVHRNRSMPTSSSKDARKAFVAKLEAGAPKPQGGKKVGRSPTFVVPNANNVKQLLLKWCQSKTRGYEHVDIMNFSSSWASGMAFCALVHNFFPDAFDYNKLDPKNKAENLELAFTKADEHGEIPQLLDAEDMMIMAEPDWKCVYTYIVEFYKRIRELDLN